jgi:hypothetical protein
MRFMIIVAVLALAGLSSNAAAEVLSSSEHGFAITLRREVAADVPKAFSSLLRIPDWWAAEHTYSGDASNLQIDARPAGLFLERLEDGGFVEHMRVSMIMRDKLIRMEGALGPLSSYGLAGSMTWSVEPSKTEGETMVVWRYVVGGYGENLVEVSKAVDSVLGLQVDRFVKFAEKPLVIESDTLASDSHLSKRTEHTFASGDGFKAPLIGLDAFQFVVGRWSGEALGGWCEETWSPPAGGEMQGMFQLVRDEKVTFRELFALRKSDTGEWELRLKHFNADLKGWEENDQPAIFRLLQARRNQLIFEGLTMELSATGQLIVYVASGEGKELRFEYSPN